MAVLVSLVFLSFAIILPLCFPLLFSWFYWPWLNMVFWCVCFYHASYDRIISFYLVSFLPTCSWLSALVVTVFAWLGFGLDSVSSSHRFTSSAAGIGIGLRVPGFSFRSFVFRWLLSPSLLSSSLLSWLLSSDLIVCAGVDIGLHAPGFPFRFFVSRWLLLPSLISFPLL